MLTHRFTVVPILLAMAIGIASMPTNIFQICRQGVGTLEVEPWRERSSSFVRAGLSLLQRLVSSVTSFGGVQVAAAAGAVLLMAVSSDLSSDSLLSVGLIGGSLKLFRQRDAELRTQLVAKTKERSEIGVAALKDGRDLTADETARFEALTTEINAIEAKIDANGTQLRAAEEANEAERNLQLLRPDPDAHAAAQGRASVPSIQMGANHAESDPKRGFQDHREFLRAVMDAGSGRRVDARLLPLRAAQGSDEQGTYDNAYGGFLVPHGVSPGILSVGQGDNPLVSLYTSVPMTNPIVSFNSRVDKNHATSVSGGFTVTRTPEAVSADAKRTKFEQVTLRANKEVGLAIATDEVLTDSPISFVSIIQAGFRDEYVASEMRESISGSGVGERQGALTAGCKVTVSKETGQKASTILKENIDKMAARCWRYGRAIWLANHNTRPQLKSIVQAVGTGGSVVPYFLTEGAPAGFDGMLDGRPLLFTEFAKTLGTEGDLILMVPSEYLWGTYQSEQFAESMHVRFEANERAFRFYRRNDAQWWWTTALTPVNGDTLSPVVTLATRS